MPYSPSAKKRRRQADTHRQRNRALHSALRTVLKKVHTAEPGADAQEAFRQAEQLLDRSARKHLIHPAKAARTKSRLQKLIRSKAQPATP